MKFLKRKTQPRFIRHSYATALPETMMIEKGLSLKTDPELLQLKDIALEINLEIGHKCKNGI